MEFSKVFKQKKAQTSLEYLLILAGAVIVVVVVALVLKGIAKSSGEQVSDAVPNT